MCVYRMQSYRKTEMDTVPHRHRMANLAAPLGEVCMLTLLGTSHFYWSANACPRSGDGRSLGCLRVHRHSQAWLVAMRFLSCLTTVSMSFCLSRSFLRSCKNILFLRLVSFIFSSRASAVCGFTLRYLHVGLP